MSGLNILALPGIMPGTLLATMRPLDVAQRPYAGLADTHGPDAAAAASTASPAVPGEGGDDAGTA